MRTVKKGKGKCKACGSKNNLHVHHFNYRFKYAGSASKATKDTVLLCGGCHRAFHEKYGVKKEMEKETNQFIAEVRKGIKEAKEMWAELLQQDEWLRNLK